MIRPAAFLSGARRFLPLAIAILVSGAGGRRGVARADEIPVTSDTDVVDGDVSSPAALLARPGADGISLREALLAAEGARGPHDIVLSSSLSGRSIVAADPLPPITRDGVSLRGPADASGRPLVTISGSPLSVFASHFRAAGLRLTASRGAAVFVYAGDPGFPGSATVEDIRIENDVLDGRGATDLGHGIAFGTSEDSDHAAVRGVRISGNSFLGFRGDVAAVLGEVGGTSGEMRDVTVAGNTFDGNSMAVRLGLAGRGDLLSGVTIARNDFADNDIAIASISDASPGRPPSAGGVVERIRIEGNLIEEGENAAIYFLAGGSGATDQVVKDVDIVNDVIRGGRDFAIGGEAGSGPGSTGNRIEDVRVVNDTIAVGGERSGLAFSVDSYGATGNAISGIEAVNSIFAGAGSAIAGEGFAPTVSHCILHDARYDGREGNFDADPSFVDAAGGDFHLAPSSPAIGAGTPDAAPCVDLDGRARLVDGAVDIGAYEFGAPFRARPCPVVAPDAAGAAVLRPR